MECRDPRNPVEIRPVVDLDQDIPHANRYDVTDSASVPQAWILPQAWRRVVERLQANGVDMTAIPRDTTMLLEVTWIESFTSASRPYEGHHPVTVDSIRTELVPVDLYAGDWVIPSNQRAKRYLTEVFRLVATMRFWSGTS